MEPFEITVGGQRLRGEVAGPAVARTWIYHHGFGSERLGFKGRAFRDAALATGQRFVAADFRGHGSSEGSIAQMFLSHYVADATAVLARFATPERPAVVVGSSLGGLASLWAAAQAPELVAALVLIAPALGWIPRLARLPRADGMIVVRNQWIDHRIPVAALDDCALWPEAELPRRVRAPVLLFHGTDDQQVPYAESAALARQLPADRCQLRTFAGGDHRLLEQLPVMVHEAQAFVAALEGAPRKVSGS